MKYSKSVVHRKASVTTFHFRRQTFTLVFINCFEENIIVEILSSFIMSLLASKERVVLKVISPSAVVQQDSLFSDEIRQ